MTDSTFFILALLAAILFVFFLLWRNERALRRQEGGEHVKPPKPWPKPVEKLDVKLSVDDQFTPALVEVQAVTGRYFNRAEDRLPIVLLSAGDLDSIDDPEVAILQQQLDPGLILSVTDPRRAAPRFTTTGASSWIPSRGLRSATRAR